MNKREWRFNDDDRNKYVDQYCAVRRNIVSKNIWADLWRRGRASAISALPVLCVLGWGLPTAHARKKKLATLAGITSSTFTKGLDILANEGLVEYCHAGSGDLISFRLSDAVRSFMEADGYRQPDDRFTFRLGAWVMYTGAWAMMEPAQRSIYFALLATTRYAADVPFHDAGGVTREEVRALTSAADNALLQSLGAIVPAPWPEPDDYQLYRCALLSYANIAEMTGLPRRTAIAAISKMSFLRDAAPFFSVTFGGERLYHVPIRAPSYFLPRFLNGEGDAARYRSFAAKRAHLRRN